MTDQTCKVKSLVCVANAVPTPYEPLPDRDRGFPVASNSVHCVVTSPPYLNQRNYMDNASQIGMEGLHDCLAWARGGKICDRCYTCAIRKVFSEVWRVLRDDGVAVLNVGDKFNGSGGAGGDYNAGGSREGQPKFGRLDIPGMKSKNLLGIPWHLAFALQADGWYLRSEVIWLKDSPQPEPGLDRPTRAHEQIFLLSKTDTYYWDRQALMDWVTQQNILFGDQKKGANLRSILAVKNVRRRADGEVKHYAAYPTGLVEPWILAGTSRRGCCPTCGSPWVRVLRRLDERSWKERNEYTDSPKYALSSNESGRNDGRADYAIPEFEELGWRPGCACYPMQWPYSRSKVNEIMRDGKGSSLELAEILLRTFADYETRPCVVFDPFIGSGTTSIVAERLGRRSIGLDINEEYAKLAQRSILAESGTPPAKPANDRNDLAGLPLFEERE